MRTPSSPLVTLLRVACLSACSEGSSRASAGSEIETSDAAPVIIDTESAPAAEAAEIVPELPSGPPTSLEEARAMAIGTWEGQDTNGIFTRYEISGSGQSLTVVECSMYSDMQCGEIGGAHEVFQKRFLDTGEPYFAVQLAWGTSLVLRSATEATVSDEDGSVPFRKK